VKFRRSPDMRHTFNFGILPVQFGPDHDRMSCILSTPGCTPLSNAFSSQYRSGKTGNRNVGKGHSVIVERRITSQPVQY
jgi:hypothetical protein